MTNQRLQLTWYNKDKALIPTETGKYGYTWVDPSDPRYCETHTLVLDDYVHGSQTPTLGECVAVQEVELRSQGDGCLFFAESRDIAYTGTRRPELDDKCVDKTKFACLNSEAKTVIVFSSPNEPRSATLFNRCRFLGAARVAGSWRA